MLWLDLKFRFDHRDRLLAGAALLGRGMNLGVDDEIDDQVLELR